jgi:hypothetical protein
MVPIANRIMEHRPKTVAGLAIFARATSFVHADVFDLEDLMGDERTREVVEAMCAFCGVTPLPAEVGGRAAS